MTDPIDQLRAALAGRYTIERLLGEGGMATVYLAHDPRHDRDVAIKILRPELAASLGPERFLREIKLAARLQHPNILALYDSGEAGGFLYYVMPFIEGESLRDRLNRDQQLSIEEAVSITCQVAGALHYAHTHGVIHRDIKPENILLQREHALVADFGIAKAVDSAVAAPAGGTGRPAGTALTQAGAAIGTPYYMSPEQGAGDHLDGRTDQYSLACVLYETLIGQPPFTGPNAMAVLARHSMETVPSIQVVRHAVPDELEDAIMRALEKTPADRFPTMQHFMDAIGEATPASPMRRTTPRTMVPPLRRTTPRDTTPVRRTTATPAEAPRRRWIVAGGVVVVLIAAALVGWRLLAHRGAEAESAAAKLDPNRIAVLYLERAPGSPDSLTYLADAVTEALIHELSSVAGLQVISSNGVRRYKGANADVSQVARDLHAGTVVHGDIAQSNARLRINVALIDANSLVEIGSRTLERPRTEIFALQDELAREVGVFLRRQLGQEIRLRASRSAAHNAAAWERYQRAQQEARDADALVLAGDTATAGRRLNRADSLLAESERLDPKWAMPPALRAWLTYRRARMAPSAPAHYTEELVTHGLGYAERALALDSADADALEARGTLRYWKWLSNLGGTREAAAKLYQDAEHDLRAAVEVNPGQASAWTTLSHLLINKPAAAEAKLAAMRAYEADPYLTNANVTLWRLVLTSYQLEDPVETDRWCQEGQRRFPDDIRFAECRLWYYSMPGATVQFDEAWKALDRYVALSPPSDQPLSRLRGQLRIAMALARAGHADSARHLAQRSRGNASIDPSRELAELEAIVYTALGDKDAAFEQLSVYVASNPQQRQAVASWEFRELEGDPRYQSIVTGR